MSEGPWIGLREYAEQWVDAQLEAEPDPEARAVLAFHRDKIADVVEADMLRQMGMASTGEWLQ